MAEKKKKNDKKPFSGDRWGDIKAVSVDPSKIKFANRPNTDKKKK